MSKPFDQELYDTYNEKVMASIIQNLHIDKHTIWRNPDRYGIDLIITDGIGTPKGGIEAEFHGRYWTGWQFPYPTIHFLDRKTKYNGDRCYYVMINHDGSNAVMIPFNKLVKYPKKIMNNRYVQGEAMYDVPVGECVWGWAAIAYYIETELTATVSKVYKGLDAYCG